MVVNASSTNPETSRARRKVRSGSLREAGLAGKPVAFMKRNPTLQRPIGDARI
jgi:hypothetical protein